MLQFKIEWDNSRNLEILVLRNRHRDHFQDYNKYKITWDVCLYKYTQTRGDNDSGGEITEEGNTTVTNKACLVKGEGKE